MPFGRGGIGGYLFFVLSPRLFLLLAGICSAASWYFRRITSRSTVASGIFKSISSMVSATICDTARLRNHL